MSSFLFAKRLLFLCSSLSADSFSSPSSPNLKKKKKKHLPLFYKMTRGTRWRAPTAFCSAFPSSIVLCRCTAVYICIPCQETWGTWEQSKRTSSPGVGCLLSRSEPSKSSNHWSQPVAPRKRECTYAVFGGVMAVTSEAEYTARNMLLNVRNVCFFIYLWHEKIQRLDVISRGRI